MNENALERWRHSHSFGQDLKRPGEAKTMIVIAITGAMMVVEIVAGMLFGSMALLADGLHMASHAAALSINAFAYIYARRHAHDRRFSFGTGKVNTLGGFTGAILLAGFAAIMAFESVERLISPVAIAYNQAIAVAVIGLIVNGASVFILEHKPRPAEDGARAARAAGTRSADADHDHVHDHSNVRDRMQHVEAHGHHHHDHHHDHNLVSAYLHVLADALTSLLAIFALLAAKYLALGFMDPLMGIVGSVLVARWSWGLLLTTSNVLLDKSAPEALQEAIAGSIIEEGDELVDLHVWPVGPEMYSAIVAVASTAPKSPDQYRARIAGLARLVHVTVEVNELATD